MSAEPASEQPRPLRPGNQEELLLLRAIQRALDAWLVAPYLADNEVRLREAATSYHDFKKRTT